MRVPIARRLAVLNHRTAFLTCSRRPTPVPWRVTTLTCSRKFHAEGLVLAPVLFTGLFLALWTWKCLMLVVFQNKIIYMPGLPPNARRETIEDYAARCVGLHWREERTRSADGKRLALCVADFDLGSPPPPGTAGSDAAAFYILYFQGNASSIPPRLPDLSAVLALLRRRMSRETKNIHCTFVCLSYRGYWTSSGSPNEQGIRLDAIASLRWISELHKESRLESPAQVVLWGQSIGSGVATNLAAEASMPENLQLNSLILETPFTNVRAMLEVLYPQKWLPYRHLWPFLRNHLDSLANLQTIAQKATAKPGPRVFILQAAKDELVPAELSESLYQRCEEVGIPVEKKAVNSAFHNDTMFRPEGRKAVATFIEQQMLTALDNKS